MTGTKMLNPMYSIATDGTIAYAEQIKDEGSGKFQSQINAEQAQKNTQQDRDIKKALAWAAAGMVL